MDSTVKDKYAGATINIIVNCDPEDFISRMPRYKEKPYVVFPFLGKRFCEEVADGQKISCTKSPLLSNEPVPVPVPVPVPGTGTVGYWISERDKVNSFLGITAFHVLDGTAIESKFASHESNCLNFMKNTGEYELPGEDGEYTCTYAAGLFDCSLDVGIVRCTKEENAPDREADKASFQWPPDLYDIVSTNKIKLRNILMDYENINQRLAIFHNGRSSKICRKSGILRFDAPSEALGVDGSGAIAMSCDAITVEPVAIVEEVPLNLESLKEVIKMYESNGEESDEPHYSDSWSGVDESPAAVNKTDLSPCDNKYGDPSKNKGSSPNGSMTFLEGDSIMCVSSDSGNFQGNKKAIMEESDSDLKDDATQRFTHGGDSGCVYYLLIEKDGQHLKAPIAIHRFSVEHINGGRKKIRISYGSPIGMALKEMKELHGLDVWLQH